MKTCHLKQKILRPKVIFSNVSKSYGVWKSLKMSHYKLRAKLATFTFWVDKRMKKMPRNGQTVLPDRSILIGQKLLENAKID